MKDSITWNKVCKILHKADAIRVDGDTLTDDYLVSDDTVLICGCARITQEDNPRVEIGNCGRELRLIDVNGCPVDLMPLFPVKQ